MLVPIIHIDLVGLGEQDAKRALVEGLKPSGRPVGPIRFPGQWTEPTVPTAPFPPDLGRLHGVPELPPHYLPRAEDLSGIKQKLLAGNGNVGITGTSSAVGVQGMGGIGKTVLAAALAHDQEVRKAFPDGIYWITVGQKPNLLVLQNQLLRQLTGSEQVLITEQEAKDALREALEGRAALLVLDDAWTIDHADAFSATAPPARLIITTRNNEVLVGIGAEEHRVDVLSPSDALKMLAEWVGQKSPDKLPVEAADVAKECGYLPLALAMIGAMIRLRPTGWNDALRRLKRADLAAIKRAFPGYPYPDLLRAIEVSVEALEGPDRECYLDLAVFPEDLPIPEEPLCALWNLDDADARDCMTRLVARSLATRSEAGGSEALILHDLQRDLIRKRREKELPSLHLRLVKAWDALAKPPDPYAWRWLAYHLVWAGCKHGLHRLLLDFEYLQGKLAATDANALATDYDYFPDDEELCFIQSAIRLSAHVLVRDPRHLAGQLTGRLIGNRTPKIQALVRQAAERKSWPWLQPLKAAFIPPGGPLIRTLAEHADWVYAVAMMPDGHRSVSGSGDRTLRLWDLGTGQTLRTLEGHLDRVRAVAVTPDGCRAVSGSDDRTLRLWDLGTGQTLRTLEGHLDRVRAVAITPDGRRAVSGSGDNTLRIWDLESGQTLCTLKGHSGFVMGVAITPDGRRALSGSGDWTLRLWDLNSGQTIRTLEGHTSEVWAVAITPDGRRALSGSGDRTLRLWDLESGQTLRTLQGHTSEVWSVVVTSDGHRAVSGSRDRTLRLWDLESGRTLRAFEGLTGWVRAVAVSPDGRQAVSGSQTLRVWNLESGQTLSALEGHTSGVRAVAIAPDGCRVVSGSGDRTLRVWDLESGQILRTLQGHTSEVWTVAVTPNGRRAVSGSHDRTLRVWDVENGQTLRTLQGHTDFVYAVAATPDGCRAVSGSGDKTLRLWDLETGRMIRTLEGHAGSVYAVAVTPDGCRAVSGSSDRTLRLWDLGDGQTIRTLEGHTSGIRAVAVTPDGCRAVSASRDGTLRVWDLESGQTLRALEGHTNEVRAVAITPDGCRAVSASRDGTLRVWDLESGGEITTFAGDGSMFSCTFTPEGQTIIVGDDLGRMHFLRLVEADPTKPAIGEAKIQLLHREEPATDS
jgi:WD40 repeat protein